MKKFLFLFLFININLFAQVDLINPKTPVQKDPFFNKAADPKALPAEKVHHTHSDRFGKDPARYDGNPFFEGNVQFDHQGSVLTADIVILYQEQNFVKAIGNVKLTNPDGSVITSGEMEYDGETQRGIARKNVILTDPTQTIKTETLYYDRVSNLAYFNTGGTIYANNSVTYVKNATYNTSTKIINLTNNIKIENDQYTLIGDNIVQDQNTNIATINGPTTITNKKNTSNIIYTEKGTYNQNSKEVYLNKNSKIYYNGKVLTGDAMYFNQITGFGTSKGHVTLDDPKENRYIKGGYGEIYQFKDSAMVTDKPYAVKLLDKDSIYFSADRFLTYQKPDSTLTKKSFLRAYKKVRVFKSNAQARADSLSFNETDGIMHLNGAPIVWSGTKQVTGDKIDIFFDTKKEYIDSLKVIGNAFAISKADSLNLKDEFNQIKGKLMTVYYKQNEVKLAKVIGNAQAITYADDDNQKTGVAERIGVALSTCGTIEADFTDQKIQIISCNIGANSDIYPMSKISKKQRFFPDFNWNTKDRLLKWQDIFVDSPDNPETVYSSDDSIFQQAEDARKKLEEKNKPKEIKRERR
ncbi:OstA-like protein [Halpernia frigidisoli]|uniref:OstA-like protein n=1 Tax=Halpernia frigidisoli TaxID=1125876 RepID=A0A1I3J2D3_9FLAO|nr:OstA-like protein [Halpernia frigidisoli]SFI54462.1 OstA-like protein [Halpernia frigidisoli]